MPVKETGGEEQQNRGGGNYQHTCSMSLVLARRSNKYSRTPVSADSVSAVSVISGLLRTENINTFTAKVDHGRFKYLRFNLPASTLVDLKYTCIGFANIRGFGHPR
jgi:hypothetical protein